MTSKHIFLRPASYKLTGFYLYPDGRRVPAFGVRRLSQIASGKRRIEVETRQGEGAAPQKVSYEVDLEADRPIARFRQESSRPSSRLKGEGISTDRALTVGYDSEDRSILAQETSVRLDSGRYLLVGAVWQGGELLFAYEMEAVEETPASVA